MMLNARVHLNYKGITVTIRSGQHSNWIDLKYKDSELTIFTNTAEQAKTLHDAFVVCGVKSGNTHVEHEVETAVTE